MSLKIAITSPIPATPTQQFLDALPTDYDLIVIDDSNGKINLPKRDNIQIYDYAAQKKILGKYFDDYTKFHHSASCRNLAHFIAYKQGYDAVIALDYDCVVPKGFIKNHSEILGKQDLRALKTKSGWINPLENTTWFTRGFPYSQRGTYTGETEVEVKNKRIVLNMGLWENVVDINGIDKVLEKAPSKFALKRTHTAALGYIPLCGMNNIFLSEIIPAYFFLPNFKIGNWEVSRHDDIWGGYILQRLTHKKGDLITYGKPVVFHERESSQPHVLYYEHFMHILEPYFYELIDAATENIQKNDYQTMFAEFADNYISELEKRRKKMPQSYFDGFVYLGHFIQLWKIFFQKL